MISRSNYVAILLIMCAVLGMFLFTGISQSLVMATGENIYAAEAPSDETVSLRRQQYETLADSLLTASRAEAEVGLVGGSGACLDVAEAWCVAQKKSVCRYDSLSQAARDRNGAPFLIVDGAYLTDEDAATLSELSRQGRHVVVSDLPDLSVLRHEIRLQSTLGIAEVYGEVTLEGVKLFSGLVLGGETVYTEYEMTVPGVRLREAVTAYMVAWAESGPIAEMDGTDLPVLIWSYAPDAGKVYVVNGDFLTSSQGAGLLTGFAANSSPVYVYPVVNAQISVVQNFPMIADENSETMEQEYGQNSVSVFRDILWPAITAIGYDTGDVFTTTASLRLDYTRTDELNPFLIQFYYEQITRESGEIGLSGAQISDLSLEEKLESDLALWREEAPNYEFLTFQPGGADESEYLPLLEEGRALESVRTVLTAYDEEEAGPFFRYVTDSVLALPTYMDSTVIENTDDFRARCLQTAYGYYAANVDAARVAYPTGLEDTWNRMSEEWSKNYRPYRVPFECFDKMTAAQADARVRDYLALEFDVSAQDGVVLLTVNSEAQTNYFILRTHGDAVAEITGGACEEIEDGWYLISAEESSVRIRLEQTDKAWYYIS